MKPFLIPFAYDSNGNIVDVTSANKNTTYYCSCGTVNERDLLASQNILKEGRRSLGDLTDVEVEVTKPMKRLELNVIN